MKVKITVRNMYEYIDIRFDTDTGRFLVNGIESKHDPKECLSKLQLIVASWRLSMIDDTVIDGEEYSVTMVMGDKVREYIGRNSFPMNYPEFKKFIKDYV